MSILAKKKRLKTAIELMTNEKRFFYDLFCDHGLLGYELKRLYPKSTIIWNDKNPQIIASLIEKWPEHSDAITLGDAGELPLQNNSGVFMLGVGGHLMVTCLKSWSKLGVLYQQENCFILGPTYYQLELRGALYELGARLEKRAFAWERGVGHEIFGVTFPHSPGLYDDRFLKFDISFWKDASLADREALTYLKKRSESLKKNRALKGWQLEYATNLEHFF